MDNNKPVGVPHDIPTEVLERIDKGIAALIEEKMRVWPTLPYSFWTTDRAIFIARESALAEYRHSQNADLPDIHVGDIPQKVLRWVNASERLPYDGIEDLFCKVKGEKCVLQFHDNMFFYYNQNKDRYIDINLPLQDVEWLEEAGTPAAIDVESMMHMDMPEYLKDGRDKGRYAWESGYKAACARFTGQQSTETPALGKHQRFNCKKQMEEGGIGCSEECNFCKTNWKELFPKESVPAQQGEVPEEILTWINTFIRESLPLIKKDDNNHAAAINGNIVKYRILCEDIAIAMYHRDQAQIKALQYQLQDYEDKLQGICRLGT